MNKRVVLIVGMLIAAGVAAFYFYRKRKIPYYDYGKARWAGDVSSENLAIRSSKKPSVKPGDTIEIIQDNSGAAYPQINGTAVVTDTFGPETSWDEKSYWIVVDKDHPGSGPQEPGTYRRV